MSVRRASPTADRQACRTASPWTYGQSVAIHQLPTTPRPRWSWPLALLFPLVLAGCWPPPAPERPAQEIQSSATASGRDVQVNSPQGPSGLPGDAASHPAPRAGPGEDTPQAAAGGSRADGTWDVDLRRDERRGGHTIARHVGRTDAELKARLQRESISAASTYADLQSAERVVARALAENARRVQRWIDRRSPKANLAIRYRARDGIPTGRLVRRGADQSSDVTGAVVVLRWRDDGWYVLTTYPENPR